MLCTLVFLLIRYGIIARVGRYFYRRIEPFDGVVVIAVSEEGVGAEDIEPAAMAQDSGPGGVVIGVLKGDSAAGLDAFVDSVHDVIAAFVVGLRAGVDMDVAIKLLRLGLRGQTAR